MVDRRRFLALCAAVGLGAACRGDDRSGTHIVGDAERTRIRYGDHSDAFADLWLPRDLDASASPLPVVVLIHGGFWRQHYRLDLMDDVAGSLVTAGFAAWNIEYRRVGGQGGYPETFDDVAAAVDHLPELADRPLDLDRVAVVGHSAGGHLSGWVASRGVLPADAPGADPAVTPRVAFSLAGVLDLVDCARNGLGDGACPALVGGTPDDVPERYRVTSPIELVPVGLPVIAVHGDADKTVPLLQSQAYVKAARAVGDPAELVVIPGANHFDMIDPTHPAWQAVLDRL